MDYSNIIIAVCTAIGTILAIGTLISNALDKINKRFDSVEKEQRNQGERLARVEGYLEGRDVGSKERRGA